MFRTTIVALLALAAIPAAQAQTATSRISTVCFTNNSGETVRVTLAFARPPGQPQPRPVDGRLTPDSNQLCVSGTNVSSLYVQASHGDRIGMLCRHTLYAPFSLRIRITMDASDRLQRRCPIT